MSTLTTKIGMDKHIQINQMFLFNIRKGEKPENAVEVICLVDCLCRFDPWHPQHLYIWLNNKIRKM